MKPVLAITMGDPAGIGPELCLRALVEPSVRAVCVPVVFGDAAVLEEVREELARIGRQPNCAEPSVRVLDRAEWSRATAVDAPAVVDCAALAHSRVTPGRVSAECGRASFEYVQRAVEEALAGRVAGIVTAPIHKEALRLAGVPYPGHTEMLAALTGARRSCMMLWSPELVVSLVTTHIGYAEVPGALSVARVLEVIELTHEAMQRLAAGPVRLGVCGLNPHAGEHGLFGQREEQRFIEPAIQRARELGMEVEGPLSPDAAFTAQQRRRYSAIVCLYHDQGHIPFKMLAFETGVNVTLGLPIVRTSVDHGTAFDIAWKGVANPQSLFSAVRLAARLVEHRGARADALPAAAATAGESIRA
ncbi:MAG: 4-hydroxythreonine-4-phosphate dehydrogenase PdxA [Verrucomicrobiae bacterium]|nr:4-hydroxythreonine-4-phosphate dehydrogenase PdxA [Verrucomicrobiae bacterium]